MPIDPPRIEWRRRCASGACVEVAEVGRSVAVRDSKDPDGAVVLFTRSAWSEFLTGIRQYEPRR
ncbi:DUF397 domain-containing protein [Asanoa iriomotensis]|uniref:DUF397 domain-containing protein n=1 Tax=Asanoa iriomotensis TaxID=234613 RepID=A0ABQ4C6Z0_9ACTN|nr:DUF397 domain-containing protein [Asanoa iriomotensis]GIF58553.1 hypothetical protein Air01nite_46480 [Asanoa iriomotensis]